MKKIKKKNSKAKKKKVDNDKELIRIEDFRTGTPLAPVIWERDEIKENLQKPLSNQEWISKLTNQIGSVASEIEKEELDTKSLEYALIKTAAMSLIWIEHIRTLRHTKK